MGTMFPRTTVAGIDMPRMIAGTNWILGYSHTSSSADQMIVKRNKNREAIVSMLRAYNEYGINAVMGPFGDNPCWPTRCIRRRTSLAAKSSLWIRRL